MNIIASRREKRIEASGTAVSFGLVYLTVLTRSGADLPEFSPDRSAPKETVLHYYQHNINDFLAKTARLSDRHKLIYLHLKWHYLQTESSLPDDDKERLCQIAGCKMKDLEFVLKAMFRPLGNAWWSEDLENMIHHYQQHKEACARGGANSHKNRPKKGGIFGGPRDIEVRKEVESFFQTPVTPLKGTEGSVKGTVTPLKAPISN